MVPQIVRFSLSTCLACLLACCTHELTWSRCISFTLLENDSTLLHFASECLHFASRGVTPREMNFDFALDPLRPLHFASGDSNLLPLRFNLLQEDFTLLGATPLCFHRRDFASGAFTLLRNDSTVLPETPRQHRLRRIGLLSLDRFEGEGVQIRALAMSNNQILSCHGIQHRQQSWRSISFEDFSQNSKIV